MPKYTRLPVTREWIRRCGAVLLASLALCWASPALAAGNYAPPGLYDVRYLTLENGLAVVLKKRTHAHNVAVRLVVDVGHRHFGCDKRETTHFLEHLLFTGTSRYSEAELDRLIEDHGGSWNAATSETETEYQIDIFDSYLPLAIETLHEIITDTVITPAKIEQTREIIRQELGGKTSALRRWLYRRGIGKSALTKSREALLPGTGIVCPGLDTPANIAEGDVKQAYRDYYVPNNMSMIIVGNFDETAVLRQINDTFGRMATSNATTHNLTTPPYPDQAREVSGTFSPLLGSNAAVGVAYRTDGLGSPDFYALWVLYVYLDRALYERIRVAEGLSYSPEAMYSWDVDYGLFAAVADAELGKLDVVGAMIDEEIDKLRRRPPDNDELENAKRRILLARVQGYESNAGVASYYVRNLHELRIHGRLLDHETAIANLTPSDIQRVVSKYLREDRQIAFRSVPTLTYTQFFALLIITVIGIAALGVYAYWRVARGRRAHAAQRSSGAG